MIKFNHITFRKSNPWGEVVEEFSEKIKEKIGGKVHKLVEPNFSTTTSNERLTCQVLQTISNKK